MDVLKDYFQAEKSESLLFIAVGASALLGSLVLLFFLKESFWKGLAIPLLVFASVQLVIGSIVYARSPTDFVRVEYLRKNTPWKIKTDEIPRMEKVMKNFVFYRLFEIALIFVGIVLMYASATYGFWKGFGLGLFLQCAALLSLDFFAEKRGHAYAQYLQTLIPTPRTHARQ